MSLKSSDPSSFSPCPSRQPASHQQQLTFQGSPTQIYGSLKSRGCVGGREVYDPAQELHDYFKAKKVGLWKALDLFSRGHDSDEHTRSYPGYKEVRIGYQVLWGFLL